MPEVLQSGIEPRGVLYEFERFLQRHGIEQRLSTLYNLQYRPRRVSKEGLAAQLVEGKTFADAVRPVL